MPTLNFFCLRSIRYIRKPLRVLYCKRFLTDQSKPNSNDSKPNDKKVRTILDNFTVENIRKTTTDSMYEINKAYHELERKVYKTTADSISGVNKAYHELEQGFMTRINEHSTSRFRYILLGSLVLLIWILIVGGASIKKHFAKQTAGIAQETLGNESLTSQTQELATAVVQTILTDKEIAYQTVAFLRDATTVPEVQEALLKLTIHILQHPDTVKQLNLLVIKLLEDLSNDKDAILSVSNLFANAMAHPTFLNSMYQLTSTLSKDKEFSKLLSFMLKNILSDSDVLNTTKMLLMDSAQTVLRDDEVIERSKEFVTDVLHDDTLQKEGGMAILNSVSHALKPGLWRFAGVGLVVLSVGCVRIVLSPF